MVNFLDFCTYNKSVFGVFLGIFCTYIIHFLGGIRYFLYVHNSIFGCFCIFVRTIIRVILACFWVKIGSGEGRDVNYS